MNKEHIKQFCDKYGVKAKKNNGEWITGLFLISDDPDKDSSYSLAIDNIDNCAIIDPATICRPTLWEDRNGIPLYENDIVTNGQKNYIIEFERTIPVLICLNSNMRWGLLARAPEIHIEHGKGFELTKIGNRFDNPELLEVK